MSVFPTEVSLSGLEIFPYEHFSPVNFMLTANGKREFVPRDKRFPVFVIYHLLPLPVFSIRTFLHCFYPLIFILRNSQLEFDVNLQFAVSMIL